MKASHDVWIGDKVEKAAESIGSRSDEVEYWEVLEALVEGDVKPELELHGNNLRIAVDTDAI